MRLRLRYPITTVLAVAVVAAASVAVREDPVTVETATVTRGPLVVEVVEEGRLRVVDRFAVDAPVAGRLRRCALKAGDAVIAGRTVVATIDPVEPSLLDARERERARARVEAARAVLVRARATAASAAVAASLAAREQARVESLGTRSVPARDIDRARESARMQRLARSGALEGVRIAASELSDAEAVLQRSPTGADPPVIVRAPVSGRVLGVDQPSEANVASGTRLVELGDVTRLECVVDMLSTDVVRVKPGQPARLSRWGGERIIRGRVARVASSARTKVSALGVEEQRVDVLVDVSGDVDPSDGVADGWSADVSIEVWSAPAVRRIPLGALFRHGPGWAALVVVDGRARQRPLRVGAIGDQDAEVTAGLAEGEVVVLHPGDRVRDGMLVSRSE